MMSSEFLTITFLCFLRLNNLSHFEQIKINPSANIKIELKKTDELTKVLTTSHVNSLTLQCMYSMMKMRESVIENY